MIKTVICTNEVTMSNILSGISSKLLGGGNAAYGENTQSISEMCGTLFNLDSSSGKSITSMVKKTLIANSVYVEGSLINEEVMVPLMGCLCQISVGYVLTALQLMQSVERYQTIRETVGRIATEAMFTPSYESLNLGNVIAEAFGDVTVATEAAVYKSVANDIDENVKHLAAGRHIEFEFSVCPGSGDTNIPGTVGNMPQQGSSTKTVVDKYNQTTTTTSSVKGGPSGTVVVPFYVQLFPVGMTAEVTKAIVEMNYPEGFWRRLAKVYTREIRFFRDFILAMDVVARHNKALKSDKGNVLSDFHEAKVSKQARRILSILSGVKRNNLANSIMVISSDTFKEICDSTSSDLRKANERQRFFDEAYVMLMAVVDTNYNMVEIYYNGIAPHSELPFRAIKQAGSSKSGIDLEALMQTLSRGAALKF